MSYQRERDQFVDRMAREGLPHAVTLALLRAATTLERYAELACSSEAADRDRVDCPASPVYTVHPVKRLIGRPRKPTGDCLCDVAHVGNVHESVTRIRVREAALERRIAVLVGNQTSSTARWAVDFQGDPRGYVLRVIPPSYAERNKGQDRHNWESIGVPARESRLRF